MAAAIGAARSRSGRKHAPAGPLGELFERQTTQFGIAALVATVLVVLGSLLVTFKDDLFPPERTVAAYCQTSVPTISVWMP